MAFCPVYTNPQVRADFNSIVEDYGGKPLSQMEFKSVTLRGERWGRDKFAMDAAYYMWNKHQGDMDAIFADASGEKYRLSKPTDVAPDTEIAESFDIKELTDEERSYLDAEVEGYEDFDDSDRVYDGYLAPTVESKKEPTQTIEESFDKISEKYPEIEGILTENPELANAVYSAMGLNTINGSEITYTDEEGNPCAKMGLTNTVKGTDWKIVKDFKGKPKHSNGGVDITISDKGVIMRRGGKDIKAKHGLLITNNN